jgi:hypothetical protein
MLLQPALNYVNNQPENENAPENAPENAHENALTIIPNVDVHPTGGTVANVDAVANVEKRVVAVNPIKRNESNIIY